MSDFHTLKVVQIHPFTPDIIQLLMKPDFPIAYSAGQYIMLGFEQSDLKPFSIAAAPRDDGLIECHIRVQADNDWMNRLCALQAGNGLIMQGPKDQMRVMPAHQPIVFVAGGTGFAPLKALLEEYLRQHTQVPLHFYWGARQVSDLYQHQTLQEWCNTYANLNYVPVVSQPDDSWHGATGLVHHQVLKDMPTLAHKTVYLCGPWPMLQAAKTDFLAADLDLQDFFH
jgi:CDP-4-dehydro-6-deoxyglucose reductase